MINFLHRLGFEVKLYFMIWTTAVFYSLYSFSIETNDYFKKQDVYLEEDFSEPSLIFQRHRDIANYEYELILYILELYYGWMIVFISISELLRNYTENNKIRIFQVCFTTTLLYFKLGFVPLIILIGQPLLFTVSFCIVKHKAIIYLSNVLSLIGITLIEKKLNGFTFEKADISHWDISLIYVGSSWINLKCTSYYLDNINIKHGFDSILSLYSYCLYLPTLFFGPHLPFESFKDQFNSKEYAPLKERLIIFIKNNLRLFFWMIFTYITLHYVYVNTVGFYPDHVEKISTWSLYGYGYAMGQMFHLKYIFAYGVSSNMAKFENIKIPHLPRCIGRIHLYSDMWRYFDVNLHSFLVRYIYIPSMYSRNIWNKIFSTFLIFCYIYLWHGLSGYIFIWAMLNFAAVLTEMLSKEIYKNYFKEKYAKYLGPLWTRRLTCLAAAPLLALSAISNFYYFAYIQIGNIFLYRIVTGSFYEMFVLIFILYTCCQVSTQIRHIHSISL